MMDMKCLTEFSKQILPTNNRYDNILDALDIPLVMRILCVNVEVSVAKQQLR